MKSGSNYHAIPWIKDNICNMWPFVYMLSIPTNGEFYLFTFHYNFCRESEGEKEANEHD